MTTHDEHTDSAPTSSAGTERSITNTEPSRRAEGLPRILPAAAVGVKYLHTS
jgi:hypothetical protein